MKTRPGFLVALLVLVGVTVLPLAALWFVEFGAPTVLAVAVGFLLFQVYLPYWVYTDARPQGSDVAAKWAAAVFLLPLLGIAVYLVVRSAR